MTDAFFCDFCEEYYRGSPHEKLFRKEHIDRQGTDIIHVADVCSGCWESLFGEGDGDD